MMGLKRRPTPGSGEPSQGSLPWRPQPVATFLPWSTRVPYNMLHPYSIILHIHRRARPQPQR